MELICWPAEPDLASLDIDSLTALAYSRFVGSKAEVKPFQISRFSTNFPALPSLAVRFQPARAAGDSASLKASTSTPADEVAQGLSVQKNINGLGRILSFLSDEKSEVQSQPGYCDYELSLVSFIENELKPAVLYVLWFDNAVYDTVTHPYYAKCTGFPASSVLPAKLRDAAQQRIVSTTKWHQAQHATCTFHTNSTLFKSEVPEQIVTFVMQRARDCITALNDRLANRRFLLDLEGDRNSKLQIASSNVPLSKADALLFACCALLRRANRHCNASQTSPTGLFLTAFRNSAHLGAFVDRVQSEYFSELRSANSEDRELKKNTEGDSFGSIIRKTTLVFVGGSVALACYALITGLVQLQFEDENDERKK